MLAPAGIAARLIPSSHEGSEQVTLLATIRGRDSSLKPIVLNTHLDTVPPGAPELWTACGGDPFLARIDGDQIYGLGTADTKLDFAAKVFALMAVGTPRRDVYLVGSFGEEHGLTGAKEIVEAALLPAGAMAFVGEPSRLQVVTAHKGLMVFDPIRGTLLWNKMDVQPSTRVFGDENFIYLVETSEGSAGSGRVLRASDGMELLCSRGSVS